jgi:hypothetical protein
MYIIRPAKDAAKVWRKEYEAYREEAIRIERERRATLVDKTNFRTIAETAPELGFAGWRFPGSPDEVNQGVIDAGYYVEKTDKGFCIWWDHKLCPHRQKEDGAFIRIITLIPLLFLAVMFLIAYLNKP